MKVFSYLLIFLFSIPISYTQSYDDWTWHESAILNSSPRNMQFDASDNLWMIIGTKLIKFDGVNWTATDYTEAGISTITDGLYNLAFSQNNTIWAYTSNQITDQSQLLQYHIDTDTWTTHPLPLGTTPFYRDIAVDANNHLWIIGGGDSHEFDGNNWIHHEITFPAIYEGNSSFTSIIIDDLNQKWLQTQSSICIDGGCYTPPTLVKFSDTDTLFFQSGDLGFLPWSIRLQFDTNNQPHIIGREFSTGHRLETTFENEEWLPTQEIPISGDGSASVRDFKIGPNSNWYVANNSRVIIKNDGVWDIVDLNSDTINTTQSIAVDAEGNLYLGGYEYNYFPGGNSTYDYRLGILPALNYRARGVVYLDENENGLFDANEYKFSNHPIQTTDGNRANLTNTNGEYGLLFLNPSNYDLETTLPPYFSFSNPANGTQTVNLTVQDATVEAVNFGLKINQNALDFAISMTAINNANPGFQVCYQIDYSTLSAELINGEISCNFSEILTFASASVTPSSINGNQLTFQIEPTNLIDNGSINICWDLPPDPFLLDQVLSNTCTFTPESGVDLDSTNNVFNLQQIITGPYDPNYIAVIPSGENSTGDIPKNTTTLEYTIHFQNVGNDTARTVVISNPLDANLNLASLEILGSSHDVVLDYFDDERILRWTFNDIDLVDSLTNEIGSNGFIKYQIDVATQDVGTVFQNSAAIYFDFNLPIYTNTATNTIIDEIAELESCATTVCNGTIHSGDSPQEACIICDLSQLDGYVGSTNGFTPNITPPPFCGSIENSQFFAFIAPTEDVSLMISASNCFGTPTGEGIQAEIYETADCNSSWTSVSNCVSPGTSAPFEVTANNLTVGNVYYLMIDGWAADICDFQIDVIFPTIITPPTLATPTVSPMDSPICVSTTEGTIVTYEVENLSNVDSVIWTVTGIGVIQSQSENNIQIAYNSTGSTTICAMIQGLCGAVSPDTCFVIESDTDLAVTESFIDTTLCNGRTLLVGTASFGTTGSFTETLVNEAGCDSIVQIELTILPAFYDLTTAEICPGESFEFFGNTYSEPGIYEEVYPIPNDCDSVYALELIVLPPNMVTVPAIICVGETIEFNGTTYSETGQYEAVLADQNGCDSLVILDLVVQEFMIFQTATICTGEAFEVGNSIYTEPGMYVDTLLSSQNCDSIVALELNVIPEIEASEIIVVNEDQAQQNGSILVEIIGGAPPYTYLWSNGETTSQISNLIGGIYMLTVTDSAGCEFSVLVNVDIIGSTNTQKNQTALHIFPNPVQTLTLFNIRYQNLTINTLNIDVLDIHGRLVTREKAAISKETGVISVTAPSVGGLYFVRVWNEDFEEIGKVVVD